MVLGILAVSYRINDISFVLRSTYFKVYLQVHRIREIPENCIYKNKKISRRPRSVAWEFIPFEGFIEAL